MIRPGILILETKQKQETKMTNEPQRPGAGRGQHHPDSRETRAHREGNLAHLPKLQHETSGLAPWGLGMRAGGCRDGMVADRAPSTQEGELSS